MMSQRIQMKEEVDHGFALNNGKSSQQQQNKVNLYDVNQFTDEDIDTKIQIGPRSN